MEVQGAEHLPFGRSREVDQSNWEGCGRLKWQNAIWTPIDRFIAWSQGSKTSTREEKIIKFRDKPSWPMDSGCLAQVCVRHMFRHRFPLQPTGEHQTVSNVFISANGRIRGQHNMRLKGLSQRDQQTPTNGRGRERVHWIPLKAILFGATPRRGCW